MVKSVRRKRKIRNGQRHIVSAYRIRSGRPLEQAVAVTAAHRKSRNSKESRTECKLVSVRLSKWLLVYQPLVVANPISVQA